MPGNDGHLPELRDGARPGPGGVIPLRSGERRPKPSLAGTVSQPGDNVPVLSRTTPRDSGSARAKASEGRAQTHGGRPIAQLGWISSSKLFPPVAPSQIKKPL